MIFIEYDIHMIKGGGGKWSHDAGWSIEIGTSNQLYLDIKARTPRFLIRLRGVSVSTVKYSQCRQRVRRRNYSMIL